MPEIPSIAVLIVDDHRPFRRGLAEVLSAERGFRLVGEAEDGAEAVEMARELMPDVVVMDLSMPRMGGIEATRRIKAEMPGVRIVVLTASAGDRALVDALKSGAEAWLPKGVDVEALLATLRAVGEGEPSVSPEMAAGLVEALAPRSPSALPAGAELTQREREVLALAAEGKSHGGIAAALRIAEGAVRNHLRNVLQKLHEGNRVEAVLHGRGGPTASSWK